MLEYAGYVTAGLVIMTFYLGKKVGGDQMRDEVLAIIEKDVKK